MIDHDEAYPQENPQSQLKLFVVHIGLQALARGDWARVQLVTQLLSGGLKDV
jgi:hypothetical protein